MTGDPFTGAESPAGAQKNAHLQAAIIALVSALFAALTAFAAFKDAINIYTRDRRNGRLSAGQRKE